MRAFDEGDVEFVPFSLVDRCWLAYIWDDWDPAGVIEMMSDR